MTSNNGRHAITITPGEAAAVGETGTITRIRDADASEFTDWLNHKLIFDSKPAGQVTAELEQQFNISISLPEKVAGRKLSGQLSLTNLKTSLNDLGLVLGGTFVQTGKRSYKFEAK